MSTLAPVTPLSAPDALASSDLGLPTEVPLDERDGRYLRAAIALADRGRSRGNRPFGAVLVSPEDEVLGEAWCNTSETGDCTGHAETGLVREVSPRYSREQLAQATLYSSGEPCVMCAGAIFWSNVRRVVYGIDAQRLRAFRGERLDQRDAELSCRDVFAASPYPIECIGPALVEEASQSHRGAWKL
ncbi:nucleoside deaminase [Curvibacter sp. HBC28]|uniref:Nucleoside deaminase n=1 Tax=Curvibacter microcysteis TaxID=3026419 RepID=A0ABT5MDI7_9BURK|nr:nucleoside deaminase [Curvibacter sp. HBC28]MDD0814642.1 nucleoside deaminase [Curvibacter sp. HBC28]